MPGKRKRAEASPEGERQPPRRSHKNKRSRVRCDCGCGQSVSPTTRSKHRQMQLDEVIVAPAPPGLSPALAPVLAPAVVPAPALAPAPAPAAGAEDLVFGDNDDDGAAPIFEPDADAAAAVADVAGPAQAHAEGCVNQHPGQVVRNAAETYVNTLLVEQVRSGNTQESLISSVKVYIYMY